MTSSTPPKRHRVLRSISAVAAAAVLVVSVGGYAAARRYDSKISRVSVVSSLMGTGANSDETGVSLEPMNVLVAGIDSREGLTREQEAQWHLGHADYGNQTDTIMVVHIGRDAKHVTVVSLARDSLVTIPEYKDSDGTVHKAHHDKINAAYTLGGASLLVRTVEQATGIPINHFVGVSFLGFMGMVDAVDGVEVCLAEPIKDNPKYTALDLPAGRSTIKGVMALSFVRARHVGTDFGRQKRQQQFMAGLLKKATSLGIVTNPLRLDSFVSAAAESLQVDDSLGRGQILALATKFAGIKLDQIEFASLPIADDNFTDPETGKGGYVTWKSEGSKKIFNAIIKDEGLIVSGKTPASGAVAPSSPEAIEVKVLNGSGTTGAGKEASAQLQAAGFKLVAPAGSATGSDKAKTVIHYPASQVAALPTMVATFPDAEFIPTNDGSKVFVITIGKSFTSVPTPIEVVAGGVDPNGIQVKVLNGSGSGGVATAAAEQLAAIGFTLAGTPGKSPLEPAGPTYIRFDPANAAQLATMVRAFPDAYLIGVPGQGSAFEVTVGADFKNVVDPAVPVSSSSATDPSDISIEQKPVVASSTTCQ